MKNSSLRTFFKASIVAVLLFAANCSYANIIVVDSINDSGTGSLRAAAAIAASGDTIRFNINLLTAAVDSISLSTEIDFGNKSIVIQGLYTSTDTLFISGGGTSRIFYFNGAGKVVLDSLVLINGNTTSGAGGAVYYLEGTDTLFVLNSVIKNNSTTGYGGGIMNWANAGCVTVITNSIVSGNTASEGGGIDGRASIGTSVATIIVSNSTVSSNTVSASGGGIYCQGASSRIILNSSTISENTSNYGGGISCESSITLPTSYASVLVTNSTITANTANYGGGIASSANQGCSAVTVVNSTIYDNSATTAGYGIYSYCNDSSSISVKSSIIAENGKDTSGIYNNKPTTIISNGFNIFSDVSIVGSVASDQLNQDSASINLGSLQNNGGTTETMVPLMGSVAINMGDSTDFSNAQNGPISGRRDVGAAESLSGVGISENSFDNQVSVYPNPNNGVFTIKIDGALNNNHLMIMDIAGRTVYQETLTQQQSLIELEKLQNGVYFITIQNGNQIVTKKIIKQ